jgi:hypothetical protein
MSVALIKKEISISFAPRRAATGDAERKRTAQPQTRVVYTPHPPKLPQNPVLTYLTTLLFFTIRKQ